MLQDKVKKMLDSEDLEMVRLGVHLMQQTEKREDWEKILEAFSFKIHDGPENFYQRKFDWDIENEEIIITDPALRLRNYRIRTGKGGYEMFQEALKNAGYSLPKIAEVK